MLVFIVSMFLAASLIPLTSSWEQGNGNIMDSESSLGSQPEGFIVSGTAKTDFDASYIPIYNVQDLSNIRNNLSGNYYLANDIDFSTDTSGYDNGGIDIPLKIDVLAGNILEIIIGLETDTLSESHAWFGSQGASGMTAGVAATIHNIPDDRTLSLMIGGILNSEPFAFSVEIDTTSEGEKFNDKFDSNGNFTPIGDDLTGDSDSRFNGIFDGNWYTISGMHTATYSSSGTALSSLFGYVSYNAIVMNLGVVDGSSVSMASSSLNAEAGGIAGHVIGTITNCYNTGSVAAFWNAGGIAGYVGWSSSLADCYNTGPVTASRNAGGIAGDLSSANIAGCYNNGPVSATGEASVRAGGIVGRVYASNTSVNITDCYNTGPVMASSSDKDTQIQAGGIVGRTGGYGMSNVTNCNNSGSVSASSNGKPAFVHAGGIIGQTAQDAQASNIEAGSKITNCNNSGSVSASGGDSRHAQAGGIVGRADLSKITNCNNSGSVSADGRVTAADGIVGFADRTVITDSQNTGSVSPSGGSVIGDLILAFLAMGAVIAIAGIVAAAFFLKRRRF